MAQISCSRYNTKLFDILPFVGEKMSCEASIVEYTEKDDNLIEQLDLENRNTHRFRLKKYLVAGSNFTTNRWRNGRLKSPEVQRLIAKVNCLKSEQRVSPKDHKKMYAIESSGEIFNIPETHLEKFALACEEELEYSFRTDGVNLQFFERKIEIPQLHIDLIKEFFNCEYTGVFHVKSSCHLCLYIDNEGFSLCGSKLDPWFECIHGGGCKARIFITILNGKLLYRFVNHSDTHAHNHCDTPVKLNKSPTDTPPMKSFRTGRVEGKLYAKHIEDDMFTKADTIERVEGKQQIRDPNTGNYFLNSNKHAIFLTSHFYFQDSYINITAKQKKKLKCGSVA